MVAVGGDLDDVRQPGDGVLLEFKDEVHVCLAPALEEAAHAVATQSGSCKSVVLAYRLLAVVHFECVPEGRVLVAVSGRE